jgi:ubiquinone/menaquinone biosynthesis C-methylase UbiE
VINGDGWQHFNIWEHSGTVRELYRRRCLREVEEMTAHAQAAELLAPRVKSGDVVLDAGCGSGYFFHSLSSRSKASEYFGIDAAKTLIEIGRDTLPKFGLPADRLSVQRIEDTAGTCEHVVCLNVLSNIDNYHRPLERMLLMARKSVILRDSLKDGAAYHYVRDNFLDPGVNLKVHVNHYDIGEVTAFIRDYGFDVERVVDRRTGGKPESVIGHDHYWTFLVATRRA